MYLSGPTDWILRYIKGYFYIYISEDIGPNGKSALVTLDRRSRKKNTLFIVKSSLNQGQ